MNIKRALCIILLFLLLFSAISVVSAEDRSYTIDHAIMELTVENNGLLHVNEQYHYSFDGKFNGVYRDIPLKAGESVDNVNVSADGAYPVLEKTERDGEVHLKIYLYSDKTHTKGIRDCDVTVYISYDMEHVVTLFNDVGGLQYKLWSDEWDVGVGKITAIIHLPGDSNNTYFANPAEYTKSNSTTDNTITIETTKIPKGEIYELLVLMPKEDFNDATYAKHVNENGRDLIMKNLNDSLEGRSFWNNVYTILGLLTVISPISALLIYLRYGREPKVDYDGIYERDLPTDDPPEIINAIIENKRDIGKPNMKGFEAVILNLIDRKVLKIFTQTDSETNTNDLILTFDNEKRNELKLSEKIVFDTLNNFSQDNVLNLSSLNGQLSYESNAKWFMGQYESWQSEVKNEIGKEGLKEYFHDTGSMLTKILGFGGIVLGIILIALGILTNLKGGFYSLIGGVFLLIFSIVMVSLPEDIFGQWTKNGRTFYLKWRNFKKFLEDNSLINEHPPESIVIWKKYLIYGSALGVADNVYEAMKLREINISEYDDGIFLYHHYGGYYLMHNAFQTGQVSANPTSDSGGFGGFGGGSGGGGGGAF